MKLQMKSASVIKARLGIQNGGPAHAYFTSRCAFYMNDFIPYSGNSGNFHLRENKNVATNYIEYKAPYARYQYYGVREDGTHKVKHYTTPGTGPYWDKKMWSVHKNTIIKEVQKYVETHGGT